MREQVQKITGLLDKYLKEELSPEEKSELNQWVMEDERNSLLFGELTNKKSLAEKLKIYSQADSDAMWQSTLRKINNKGKVFTLPVMPVKKAWLKIAVVKYAAAAAVVGVVSVAVWKFNASGDKQGNAGQPEQASTPNVSVLPGTTRAVLTLTDGNTVTLGITAPADAIPDQGANELKFTNEGLVYVPHAKSMDNGGQNGEPVLYNMVSTPNGGEYQFTLPDGSKVWLNAASSLRFPIAFAGNERLVQLTGEAYFEVKHASKIPFIVSVKNGADKECDVQVMGTRFNVMSYVNEPGTATTLLQGSVKIAKDGEEMIIKPGQQATVINKEIKVRSIDEAVAVAWKGEDGEIMGDDLPVVLRQVERWYDVDVVYEGEPGVKEFGGSFKKSSSFETVIKVLNVNRVNARLEGRKLIIKS